MTPLEKVRNAKNKLYDILEKENYNWLRGIGITCDSNNVYCIKINVSELTPDIEGLLPIQYDGINIIIEEVGEIIPC